MNFKLPPGVNPPPFPALENGYGYGYKVYPILNDARFDEFDAMPAYMELQRPLIEARRREAQVVNAAQIGE
jgi:hypothetical protein